MGKLCRNQDHRSVSRHVKNTERELAHFYSRLDDTTEHLHLVFRDQLSERDQESDLKRLQPVIAHVVSANT